MPDPSISFRVAIAGLGRRGRHLAERLALRGDVDILANWDPQGRALKCLAPDSQSVVRCADILQRPNLDAIIIATTHSDAAEAAECALRMGVAVAMDGVLAATTAEARKCLRAAEAGGARLSVLYPGRGEGDYRTALAAIATGEVGRLRAVRNTLWTPPLVGALHEEDGVESVAAAIDQTLSLFAAIPVTALLTWRAPSDHHADASAIGFSLTLQFAEGAVAQIDRYRDSALFDHSGWVLSGTTGGYWKGRLHRRQPDGEVYDVPFEELPDSATTPIDDWVDSLRAPPPSIESLHHDVSVVAVLEAALRSAECGQFVPIS